VSLNTEPTISDPDGFYAALIEMHRGLTPQQSELVNARLILLLANHVGDMDILKDALVRAREGVGQPDESVRE
jgi:hypothetical protein